MIIQNPDGSLIYEPGTCDEHCRRDICIVHVSSAQLQNQHMNVMERVIHFAFDTLDMLHLDIYIRNID